MKPFANLSNPTLKQKIPDWWNGYNKVKHNMDTEFNKANLKNVLNALAALFILVDHYFLEYNKTDRDAVNRLCNKAKFQQESNCFQVKAVW